MRAFTFISCIVLHGALLASTPHEHGPSCSHAAPGLPQHFLGNQGQYPSNVLYRADFGTLALFAEQDRITFSKLQDEAPAMVHDAHHKDGPSMMPALAGHAWNLRFVGGDPSARLVAQGKAEAYVNYFLGNDPSKWAANVHPYAEVTYVGLWPGVDLRLYQDDHRFKYDVVLADAAAVSSVAFKYEGLDGIALDGQGRLVLRTSVGEVVEMRPVAWYADGAREAVDCAFELNGDLVRFSLAPDVDPDRPVIIDPLVMASTLSGTGNLGMTSNFGHCGTYDNLGNVYSGARCFGQGYPVTPGAFQTTFGAGGTDISVSKLNPDGSALIWATYFGGNGQDLPNSMVVDAAGNFTVMGTTTSTNYPCSPGALQTTLAGGGFSPQDISLSKVDVSGGVLVGSTYIGGNDVDGGWGNKGEITTDAGGSIFMIASTNSSNFPTTAGAFQTTIGGLGDAVALKINPTFSALDWSTFLGGTGEDIGYGLELDATGDLYVCGAAGGGAFPSTPGTYQSAFQGGGTDGYVARLGNNGSTLVSGSFFGSPTDDVAYFVETDVAGDVYIYGYMSTNIPIVPVGGYATGGTMYVTQFDPALTSIITSSSISVPGGWGGQDFQPIAFLVDNCDHVYICAFGIGVTGLPLTPNAIQNAGGFYLAAFDVDMAGLLFATYYGGLGDHVDGGTSRFDKNGIVYQGVCTGGGFPTTPNAYSNVQPPGWDVGIFKIHFQVSGVNAAGASTANQGCAPIQINFTNSSNGNQWVWDFGDGSPLDTAYTPSHTYTVPGVYTVTLIAMDSLSCNLSDTISFAITIGQSQPLTAAFSATPDTDCSSFSVSTTNTSTGSPLSFIWDMGDGTTYTDTSVVHAYAINGTYDIELLVYDATGCSQPDSLTQTITVLPPDSVTAAFSVVQVPDCDELRVDCTNLSTGPAPSYAWDMGDGTTYTTADVVGHVYSGTGTYTITLIATDALACNQSDTATMQITLGPIAPVTAAFTAAEVFNCDSLIVTSTNTSAGSFLAFVWDMGDGTQYTDTNVTHTYTGAGIYTVTLITSDLGGCSPSDTATVQLTIDPIVPVVAAFTLDQVGNCTLLTVQGSNLSTGDSVAYVWDMGDGTTYTTTDVTHVYLGVGSYTVELLVQDLGCGDDDSLSLPVTIINDIPLVAATNGVICPDSSTVVSAAGPPGSTYLWSTGEVTDSIVVATGGDYWVQVFFDDCSGTDTVTVIEAPEQDLAYTTHVCPGTMITLTVPFDGIAYLWETGGTEQAEYLMHPGGWEDTTFYDFIVWDQHNCPHEDSVEVVSLDSEPQLFAPNAFTPDGDGVNDEFVITGFGEKEMELLIFNRWGEQIFSTNTLANSWNGQFNGQIKQDVYVYKLSYNGECTNDEVSLIGHVSVLK